MQSNGLIKNTSDQQPTSCRGVRGAVTVKENTEDAILAATRELLQVIVKRNGMHPDDIAREKSRRIIQFGNQVMGAAK